MRILVGLGNPGREYARTRHNVGFWVVERIALHEGLIFESPKTLEDFRGSTRFRLARSFDPDALLVEPSTFMNASGDVVTPLVRWAGVEPQDLMVVYDDMDLPLGALRLRPRGGHGGHNGMRSIVDGLGSDAFPRLRVGIGRPSTDAARHVLSEFTPDEQVEIDISVAEAAEAASAWLGGEDLEPLMTRFHSRWSQD
jgi:PTH1 family peptidyl-tRNA hydrolase